MLSQLIAALAGLLAGTLSGFFGIGGNLVLVPLLALLLGMGQHEAQGLTLAALLPPLGLPAVLHYRRAGVVLLWPVIALGIAGFVAGIAGGSLLANVMPGFVLRLAFVALLGSLSMRSWKQREAKTEQPMLRAPPPGFWRIALFAGLLGGLASGLLGIGGAIVMIPLFRRLGMGQRQAQVTSLAMLLPPIGLPGVLIYVHAQPTLPWALLASVAGGFLLGSMLGARLTDRISANRLERAFSVLVALAALVLLIQGVRQALS